MHKYVRLTPLPIALVELEVSCPVLSRYAFETAYELDSPLITVFQLAKLAKLTCALLGLYPK